MDLHSLYWLGVTLSFFSGIVLNLKNNNTSEGDFVYVVVISVFSWITFLVNCIDLYTKSKTEGEKDE